MRADDGEYPRGYRYKNNKYRENPGDRISKRVSKGRGIKMHLHSAAESRLSTSAKWKRSLQQLSRNSTDRYPFPLRRTASDCLKRTGCGKRGKNMEKRQRGRKREIDKEGDIARRGAEQKKRFRRLPATETPRNRRR